MPKYIILEGIKEGNKFFTGYDKSKDQTKLFDGTIAYKILGYADTIIEAQRMLNCGIDPEHDIEVLSNYLLKTGRGLFNKEACDRLARLLV